jgi:hypothetical protein
MPSMTMITKPGNPSSCRNTQQRVSSFPDPAAVPVGMRGLKAPPMLVTCASAAPRLSPCTLGLHVLLPSLLHDATFLLLASTAFLQASFIGFTTCVSTVPVAECSASSLSLHSGFVRVVNSIRL